MGGQLSSEGRLEGLATELAKGLNIDIGPTEHNGSTYLKNLRGETANLIFCYTLEEDGEEIELEEKWCRSRINIEKLGDEFSLSLSVQPGQVSEYRSHLSSLTTRSSEDVKIRAALLEAMGSYVPPQLKPGESFGETGVAFNAPIREEDLPHLTSMLLLSYLVPRPSSS